MSFGRSVLFTLKTSNWMVQSATNVTLTVFPKVFYVKRHFDNVRDSKSKISTPVLTHVSVNTAKELINFPRENNNRKFKNKKVGKFKEGVK